MATESGESRLTEHVHFLGRQFGAIYPVLIVVAAITAIFCRSFDTGVNIRGIFVGASVTGIVAIAETVVAIAGGLADLSVGSLFGFVAVLMIRLDHDGTALALLAGLGLGVGVGLVNGILACYLRANSVIVTLGTGSILGGLALWYSGGATFYLPGKTHFQWVAGSYGVIPAVFLAFVVLAVIAEILLQTTRLGRSWYAIGGSLRAAQVAGINVARVGTLSFVWAALLVAFAAELFSAFFGSANYQSGNVYLFAAIAGVAVGGTSLMGGQGGTVRTAGGVLFIALLQDVVVVTGISLFYQNVVVGVAIVAGVLVGLRGRRTWTTWTSHLPLPLRRSLRSS